MSNAARWTSAVLAVAILQACAKPAPPANTDADVAAIKAVQDREISGATTGSSDSLLAVVASDPEYMPPDEPAVHGRDAVRKWADGMFSQATLSGRYTSADVSVSGDLAVVRYTGELTVTPKAGGSAVTEHIKGIHVMKRQPDGTWKIAQDVWNSDAPPPQPTPAPAPSK